MDELELQGISGQLTIQITSAAVGAGVVKRINCYNRRSVVF